MDLAKKYQRRIKLTLIQKHFGNVEVKYVPKRDVYEPTSKNGLFTLAMQEIISGK